MDRTKVIAVCVWIAFSLLVILMYSLGRKFEKAHKRAKQANYVRRIAAWLEAYFGTMRPADYNPPAKEEAEKMIAFLEGIDHHSARFLELIAKMCKASNSLPDKIDSNDPAFDRIAAHLGGVCWALKQEQVQVA